MIETVKNTDSKLAQLLEKRPVILQFLRFGTIGAINTALDFMILNYLSKHYGITLGVDLGVINIVGVIIATIQSYFWNRAWTFSAGVASPLKNFIRLFLVGSLGFGFFVLVLLGATYSALDNYYLLLLAVFLLLEGMLWLLFGLSLGKTEGKQVGIQFVEFVVVSAIGLLINSLIVVVVSSWLAGPLSSYINIDVVKNLAKFVAICVAMVWNFIGYKLIVFKK